MKKKNENCHLRLWDSGAKNSRYFRIYYFKICCGIDLELSNKCIQNLNVQLLEKRQIFWTVWIICQYVSVTRSLIQLIAASIHWAPTVDHHYLILGSLFSLFNDTAYTYGKKLLILKPDAPEQLKKWHQL